MTASSCPFGFRIVGKTCETRRLVDHAAAFGAYRSCDQRAECHREAYLSAFQFGEDFRRLLLETGSTAGFSGPCWSPWLWWDIDAEELHHAHQDAGALAAFLVERYNVEPGDLLIFFSGSKGFHLGLPTPLWSPGPSADFHRIARRFAENLATAAAVTIDTGVYDRVRAFRAPNSRHPKTGLHKRRLTFDELLGPLEAITKLAKTPTPFGLPTVTKTSDTAAADWQAAAALVAQESEGKAARLAAGNGTPTLNRSTLDFIREGAGAGDRHRLLFSAAANLAEFGCLPALAVALLEESALDAGLAPKDVLRQIECGLSAAGTAPTQQGDQESPQDVLNGSTVQEPPQAAIGDSRGLAGQSCQQVTPLPTAGDMQAALAKLRGSTPAPKADQAEAAPQSPTLDGRSSPAVLPLDPPPLVPLPLGAVGSGTLDVPCRCGSTQYVDIGISDGRSRRDCRKCGKFLGWGKWYDQGGPTP
jgi:hypothetical protein